MNKSDCSLLKRTIVRMLCVGFLVFGVMAMSSSLVFAAEPEGEEVVEPGKVGRLEEMVEKMVKKHSLASLGLSLYGFVDLSYTQNFKNPSTQVNQNRIFDVDSNSFRVQLAQIVLEKEGKTGGAVRGCCRLSRQTQLWRRCRIHWRILWRRRCRLSRGLCTIHCAIWKRHRSSNGTYEYLDWV